MIYYVSGPVTILEAGLAVIDCGGVGYGCRVTAYTAAGLKLNQPARLYITESIREDAHDLFGFISREEQRCFELLTSVNGVGPKAAMAILSLLTPDKLSYAIVNEDTKAISRASGVGTKTAARVVLELKDKIAKQYFAPTESAAVITPVAGSAKSKGNLSEALDALIVLGYSRAEAQKALAGIDPKLEVEKIIPLALAKLF